jgi:hypothetical protein
VDRKKERTNNTLDKHIAAGGKHGKKAKEMKDRLNDGGLIGGWKQLEVEPYTFLLLF